MLTPDGTIGNMLSEPADAVWTPIFEYEQTPT